MKWGFRPQICQIKGGWHLAHTGQAAGQLVNKIYKFTIHSFDTKHQTEVTFGHFIESQWCCKMYRRGSHRSSTNLNLVFTCHWRSLVSGGEEKWVGQNLPAHPLYGGQTPMGGPCVHDSVWNCEYVAGVGAEGVVTRWLSHIGSCCLICHY